MLARKISMFVWRRCKRHIATSSQLLRGQESNPSDVRDKAALITGGASGIGLQCCKTLLRCGCRGVTIADRNNECGESALKELAEEFGNDKAVFVNCDVTKSELIDWAFKTTINAFNRLDIVINSAGVLNDKVWENEINTNICGTMVGNLLGLQYMAAHCLGHGGIVINIGSTMGLAPFGGCPIYSMTQSAILGLTRALGTGCHYDRTKVKVMAIAVGLTETPLMINASKNAINNRFSADFKKELECHKWQHADCVSEALMKAIKDGEPGAIWVVECGSKPYKVEIPCYQDLKTDCKESIVECETPCKRSKPKVLVDPECPEEGEADAKSDKAKGKEAAAGAPPKDAKSGKEPAKADAKKGDKKAPAKADPKAAGKDAPKKAGKDDCKPIVGKAITFKCPPVHRHGKPPKDMQKKADKDPKAKPPAKGAKPKPPEKAAKGKPPAKAAAKAKPPEVAAKGKPPAKGAKPPEKGAKGKPAEKGAKEKAEKDSKDSKEKDDKCAKHKTNACDIDISFKDKKSKKGKKEKSKKKKKKDDKMKIEFTGVCKKKDKKGGKKGDPKAPAGKKGVKAAKKDVKKIEKKPAKAAKGAKGAKGDAKKLAKGKSSDFDDSKTMNSKLSLDCDSDNGRQKKKEKKAKQKI